MAQPQRISCPELHSLQRQFDGAANKQANLRQLGCHTLALCNMEASPLTRYFLTLGAVWNSDRSYCSSADIKLIQAVCGDEGHFPLNSSPVLGTVYVIVRVFEARNC
jgi:hypothetical protein